MKIDVQGYEYQVLKGASKILDKINYDNYRTFHQIKFTKTNFKKILKFLSKKNFSLLRFTINHM